MSSLAPTMQAFFTDRLIRQRRASPHTIANYRDTMRLLLTFAQQRLGKQPSRLELEDVDAELVGSFLDHLEHQRGNSARTRNNRLAAIHSLFAFAALRHPEHAAQIQQVLAIAPKRFERALITWLTEAELEALLAAPDQTRWTGRRDHALLVLATHTGLRASELIALTCKDVHLGSGPYVSCLGKGRKERITPLTKNTVRVVHAWLAERRPQPNQFLFPARHGGALTRDGLDCGSPGTSPSPPPPARHSPTSTSRCIRCGITWTAGLCGRPGRFRCSRRRERRFRPHNFPRVVPLLRR
jgi:integrase/recombinase XerD